MNNSFKVNALGAADVFTHTAADTQGGYAEMLAVLPRCSEEEVLHRHPLQTVKLEAIDGKLGIMLPDRRLIIKPGQSYEIPRDTVHAFYNADEKEITFRGTLEPALHTEWLSREMKALAKRKKSKIMSMLEESYILSQIKGEYYRSGLPVAIQKVAHSFLAGIGKFLGIDKRISPVQ